MTNPKAFIHIQKLHAANFPSSYPLDIIPTQTRFNFSFHSNV